MRLIWIVYIMSSIVSLSVLKAGANPGFLVGTPTPLGRGEALISDAGAFRRKRMTRRKNRVRWGEAPPRSANVKYSHVTCKQNQWFVAGFVAVKCLISCQEVPILVYHSSKYLHANVMIRVCKSELRNM